MKHLITLAAIAAILTFSACKKAEKVETPAEEKQETVQNPDPKEENLQQDIMPSKTLIKPLYQYDENLKSVCSSKYPEFFYFYSGVVP